jgi:hypothetical protein
MLLYATPRICAVYYRCESNPCFQIANLRPCLWREKMDISVNIPAYILCCFVIKVILYSETVNFVTIINSICRSSLDLKQSIYNK